MNPEWKELTAMAARLLRETQELRASGESHDEIEACAFEILRNAVARGGEK